MLSYDEQNAYANYTRASLREIADALKSMTASWGPMFAIIDAIHCRQSHLH